jgi:hypothetical protein
MRPQRNAWRWNLDPRDPDYEDPPTLKDLEEAEESRLDAWIEQRQEQME